MASKAVFLPARANDWDWAQVQYETTDKSTTDIATEIGVTVTAVIARASSRGWVRNKGQLVARMTAEMVLANRERLAEAKSRELEVIERVNVQMQAQVLSTHRADIANARSMCTKFFSELGQEAELDLDTKSKVLSRLADSMKTLMLLERQAYGIQGVFEDTAPTAPTAPEQQATDSVMRKFAAVLAKNMGAVEVVDNDASN